MSELIQVVGPDDIVRIVDLDTAKVIAAYEASARLAVSDRVLPPPVKTENMPAPTIMAIIAAFIAICVLAFVGGALWALVP